MLYFDSREILETKTDNNPKRISSLAPAIQRWGWITLLFYILQLLHFYCKYCIIIAGEEHHEYPLHVESFAMDWDKIGTADRSGSKVIIEFILYFYCIFIVFIAFKSKYCTFPWCKDDADLHHLLNDESMIVDMLLNTIQESSNNSELTALLSGSNSSGMSLAVPFPNPRDYYR